MPEPKWDSLPWVRYLKALLRAGIPLLENRKYHRYSCIKPPLSLQCSLLTLCFLLLRINDFKLCRRAAALCLIFLTWLSCIHLGGNPNIAASSLFGPGWAPPCCYHCNIWWLHGILLHEMKFPQVSDAELELRLHRRLSPSGDNFELGRSGL